MIAHEAVVPFGIGADKDDPKVAAEEIVDEILDGIKNARRPTRYS